MKFIITLLSFILTLQVFAQSNKTLVKTIDPDGATSIAFKFEYKKLIPKKWDHKSVRIQMEIHSNISETLLSQLIKAGRYNLEGKKEGDRYFVTAPNFQKKLTIGGKSVEEEIILNVDVPEFLTISEDEIKHSSNYKRSNPKVLKPINLIVEYLPVSSNASFKYSLANKKEISDKKTLVNSIHYVKMSLNFEELEKLFGEIRVDGEKIKI